MRTLTRKLLSLLLVFTMVCAMVPAAMAADTGTMGGGNRDTGHRRGAAAKTPGTESIA